MAGKKERYAAVPMKKRAMLHGWYKRVYAAVPMKKSVMLHSWYKRALCCRAGEKERHAA
jgi:hypothetical protein